MRQFTITGHVRDSIMVEIAVPGQKREAEQANPKREKEKSFLGGFIRSGNEKLLINDFKLVGSIFLRQNRDLSAS